jgi:hypothetical protein
MFEPTVGIVSVAVLSSIMFAYYKNDSVKIRSDFEYLKFKVGVFASKVNILQQYADDVYKQAPEDIQNRIGELLSILNDLDEDLLVGEALSRNKDYLALSQIIEARLLDNNWEKRGHRLILSLCKDLTLEASLNKKRGELHENSYKRKPTLLSLKEIADLLREEKNYRL